MNIIKLILGIQACIAGFLIIVYMVGQLMYMGMELEMMADDYDIRLHNEMMSYEEENT